MAAVGSQLYFTAEDASFGRELRVLDSSNDSVTTLDLVPGASHSSAGEYGGFFAVGTKLYFDAVAPQKGVELYELDTTDNSTSVLDLNAQSGRSSWPGRRGGYATIGNNLYFSAEISSSRGYELQAVNMDTFTYTRFFEINPGNRDAFVSDDSGKNLVAIGSKLFFPATHYQRGTELHILDTTNNSLTWLDLASSVNSSLPQRMIAVGDQLYFSAFAQSIGTSAFANELRVLNATDNSTSLIRGNDFKIVDIDSPITNIGDKLYFTASGQNDSSSLRRLDPDNLVCQPICYAVETLGSVYSGAGLGPSPGRYGFEVQNGKIYFTGQAPFDGRELNVLDTADGSVSTINIQERALAGSEPGQLGGFAWTNGRLYFTAEAGTQSQQYGREPHVLDAATGLVSRIDINPAGHSNAGEFGGFLISGDKLFFTATDATHGTELRVLDTTNDTVQTIDINPTGDSNAGEFGGFAVSGNKLFFSATDATVGTELRVLDITNNTFHTIDINPTGDSNAGEFGGFAVSDNKLFFTATDATSGTELRVLDISDNTVQTVDINPTGDSNAGEFGGFAVGDDKLFFSATDATVGTELRVLDITNNSLQTIDINPAGDSNAGEFGGFAVGDDKLFFSATDATVDTELRVLDITNNTFQTTDINSTGDSNAGQFGGFVVAFDKLYFTATDPVLGTELRILDPQTSTIETVDIRTGPGGSSPGFYGGLMLTGNKLYFSANKQLGFGRNFFALDVNPDEDTDGVDDTVEVGAGGGTGDGNGDGVQDATQDNVASLPNAVSGTYVTVAADTELTDVSVTDNPSPNSSPPSDVDFPIGFVEFSTSVPSQGQIKQVTLFYDPSESFDTVYKYGPTAANPVDHFYEFGFDGTTGAEILSDRVVLHIQDGGRGDSDGVANGVISDPIALASRFGVVGVQINDGFGQRSMVNSVEVKFSGTASIVASDIEVTDDNGALLAITVAFAAPGGQTTGTITFDDYPNSLPDGNYEVRVKSANVQIDGRAMSSDHVDSFYRLFGDVAGGQDGGADGVIGLPDFLALAQLFGKSSSDAGFRAELDFNSDGVIGLPDFLQLVSRFGQSI